LSNTVTTTGVVQASQSQLAGDYNRDGSVNTADYVVWRKTLGTTGVPAFSGADGDGDGTIDPGDLAVWKANYGDTLALGAGSGSAGGEELRISHFELRIGEASDANEALDVLPTLQSVALVSKTSAERLQIGAQSVRGAPIRRADATRLPAHVTAVFDWHDKGLVAWLASRVSEARAGDDDRVKSRSEHGSNISNSPFEAVDAVFDELLVAAAGV
jgi:hypothetical protein